MKWIVSSDPRIFVNRAHMSARLQYIQSVTDAPVTDWMITRKNSAFPKSLFCCMTNDELNGTFITAHIGEVQRLCSVHEIAMSDFVIANTCIWEKSSNKQILYVLVNNCVGFSLSPFYGTQKVIAYDYPMKCEVIIT